MGIGGGATKLAGEVAIVTGSTSGIGAAAAHRMAMDGAKVIVTGRREDAGLEVQRQIEVAGGVAAYVRADVSQEADMIALVEAAVERFGPVTVLVNNAAPTDLVGPSNVDGRLGDVGTDAFESVLRVGLHGAYWLCREVLPHMVGAGRGSIVNVSSIAGVKGTPRVFAYSVAKGGLQALTRSVAADYGTDGIRANTIVVGFVPTNPLARKWAANPAMNRALHALQMTRFGEPEDVANAIAFLASEEAAFISGTDMYLDGGCSVTHAVPGTKQEAQERFG
jgi:NAD(P)-dependent dehydrogenase (short-subunit alcohol dehydrogenase family)